VLEVPVGPAFGDNSDFPRRSYMRATPEVETRFLTAVLVYSTLSTAPITERRMVEDNDGGGSGCGPFQGILN
jgi:hypothetical protein